jgi:hypothetical protein
MRLCSPVTRSGWSRNLESVLPSEMKTCLGTTDRFVSQLERPVFESEPLPEQDALNHNLDQFDCDF